MKKLQRQTGRILAILLATALFWAPCLSLQTYASAGRMVLGLSANSVEVGDKITVYISAKDAAGASVTADMKITFNTSVFEYASSNAGSAQNSGDTITANGSSISVTFKAIAAGECRVVANGTSSAGELTAGGVRIPATEAEGTTEEPQTEEPKTGDDQAEEEEEEPETTESTKGAKPAFQIDGVIYEVSEDFDNELVNKGFEPVDLTVQETTVRGLKYPNSDWTVLFLVEEGNDANNGYYLYDQKTGDICPYLSYGVGNQGDGKGDNEGGVSEEEYAKLKGRYDSLKQGNRRMMLGMIIGVVVLALIIINIFIFRGINRREELEEDYDDEDYEEDDYDEKRAIEKQGEYLKAKVKVEQAKEEEEDDEGDSLEFIDFKDL
ncbi:MAG: hypothetical protein E7280_07880 [Lachnospiraceae bacterium]|nr:hypothetical protein [Lachnospiraceae bacterium]